VRKKEPAARAAGTRAGRSGHHPALGTVLRATGPIVLRVVGVRGFDGNVGDYLLAAGGAWLALSFLAQYDPLFSAKIGAAADISKTLRG